MNVRVYLSLVLVGLFLYSTLKHSASIPVPQPISPPVDPALPHSQVPSQSDPKFVVIQPLLTSPSSSEAPPYAQKPHGNRVEFEIVNGWAVAYGDVLLGKPLEDFKDRRGHYDAPQPKTWENPEIPYLISPKLPQPQRVEKALDYFRQNTPVKFVPYQNQKDGIIFEPGEKDCYSYIGKIGGLQPIHLSAHCQPQQIMHELMHALGFVHEQSRPDRDQYVQIIWSQIQSDYFSQFAIVPDLLFEIERDTPFDYRSIMLYPTQAFAIQADRPTMQSLGPEPIAPTQDGLSDEDIRKIRQIYRR